jgi:hypothetical protein
MLNTEMETLVLHILCCVHFSPNLFGYFSDSTNMLQMKMPSLLIMLQVAEA